MQLELVFIFLSAFVTAMFLGLSYRVDRKLSKVGLQKITAYPKVSVIIPVHNRATLIKEVLVSVKNSVYKNKDIIVVNDFSTDGTGEILNGIKGIKVFTNKKRLGKAASLNEAAKKCSGDIMLFLDADTKIEKDTIERLVSSYLFYQKNGEKIGFIAPRYKLINKRSFLAKMVYIEQTIHQFLIKIQMSFGSILSIRGCCLLVGKEAFFKSGGFSNHILEDGDFSAKMAKAGYKIKYEPRATVDTEEPETVEDFFRSRKRYGKGSLFCVIDHTKHFLFSKQASLAFYPYFIISVAFIGFYFSALFSLNIVYLFSLASSLALIGLSSTIGMFLCGATTAKDSLEKTTIVALFLPYIFLYIPFAGIGYLIGALSGVKDRWRDHGKLKLKEW